MKAEYIANMLLSFEGNPQCVLHQWHNDRSHYTLLNFSCTQTAKGYVLFTDSCNMTQEMEEVEREEDKFFPGKPNSVIDYKKIAEAVLEMKKVLPALIGVDENFDKVIAEKLKE